VDLPKDFKFDVRIRERMLAKRVVSEAEVTKHLEALPDVEAHSDVVDLTQPALTTPSERPAPVHHEHRVPVAAAPVQPAPSERSAPRSIAPGPLAVDEGWDEDDDEDDEDEDEEEVAKAPRVAAKPVVPSADSEEPAADDDEDDVDSDDDSDGAGEDE
jgi:hypothetical protein